jgi:uridine kinase
MATTLITVGVAGGTGAGKVSGNSRIQFLVIFLQEHAVCILLRPFSHIALYNLFFLCLFQTTLARRIYEGLDSEKNVAFLSHDHYYKCNSHLPMEERAKVNFDHPDSLDTGLLVEHIQALKAGNSVDVPCYDFSTHTRMKGKTTTMHPKPILLVEGILIFSDPRLTDKDVLDLKVFVDAPADTRLMRRIERDVQERGRSTECVMEQYVKTVRPMHDTFVEPSKAQADLIVPNGRNLQILQMIIDHLKVQAKLL